MNEDEISQEMYLAAVADARTRVLSWQGVGGKSYLTRAVRIRTSSGAMLPDLILQRDGTLWLVEIKGTHAESAAEDEPKLRRLLSDLDNDSVLRQVAEQSRVTMDAATRVRAAVAYSTGAPESGCDSAIAHMPWVGYRPDLSSLLDLLE